MGQVAGAVPVLAAFVLVQFFFFFFFFFCRPGPGVLGLEAVCAAVSACALCTHDRAQEATA